MAVLTFSEDLLLQARQVGGDINPDFDRQTDTSARMPFYSVVGKNSKDSSYRGVLNGKSVEVSRSGEFRRKNDEGLMDYFEFLEMVVIDARTCYTIFKDNKAVARGVSTKGLSNAVWTESDGCVIVGASCDSSPYSRWTWEKQGGREGKVFDAYGNVLAKEDLATCSLQLWCYDPAADEYCIVQFSAGAIKAYREVARDIECQGVKVHSVLWRLGTRQVDNGASMAPSYVPELSPIRVLDKEEFAKADEKRAELVVKASALAAARQEALPPAPQRALPATSLFKSPPLIDVGPAEADPADVFATVD